MALKIYTRTGDKGETSLIGGTKVPKSHLRIESYGTIDELNSFIGLLKDHLSPFSAGPDDGKAAPSPDFSRYTRFLQEIQDRLFTIGASLACDPEKETRMSLPDLKEEDVLLLEKEIDSIDDSLPPMTSFILPGGHPALSTAHITRCVCRRVERVCVRMQVEEMFIDPLVITYLNRLSDYLFVLGRFLGFALDIPEIPWRPRI